VSGFLDLDKHPEMIKTEIMIKREGWKYFINIAVKCKVTKIFETREYLLLMKRIMKKPMPLGFALASGTPCELHCSFVCKRIKPVISNNNVIQNCNIKQGAAVLDLFSDLDIGFAGCYGS